MHLSRSAVVAFLASLVVGAIAASSFAVTKCCSPAKEVMPTGCDMTCLPATTCVGSYRSTAQAGACYDAIEGSCSEPVTAPVTTHRYTCMKFPCTLPDATTGERCDWGSMSSPVTFDVDSCTGTPCGD